MKINSPTLFLEINKYECNFIATKILENDEFKILYESQIPSQGFSENNISNPDLVNDLFQENILLLEKKLNLVFKEVVIILDFFETSLINFSGYKKLNGSQLVKENITYIINLLKQKIDEFENKKNILHIFNSKYLLDGKKIENLPIGLFGNLYSHELSFFLINKNDFNNLKNIFNKCNLKVKKIIFKGFLEGVNLINNNNVDTFFRIEINKQNSKILFFENSALKFYQEFIFGSDLISKDISKITGLKIQSVKEILFNLEFSENLSKDELLEKVFFKDENFRKIKKQLILDISKERIHEILEIIFVKNINILTFIKKKCPIFLNIKDQDISKSFSNLCKLFLSQKNSLEINLIPNQAKLELYRTASQVVQYGWKTEAVPITHEKKSLIARIFEFF